MFAIPASLRLFAAKHGNIQVVEFYGLRQPVETMLQVGTYDACCSFRSHSEVCAVAFLVSTIIEAIHFLLDNIAAFARGTQVDRCFLQSWCIDAAIGVEVCHRCNCVFDEAPVRLL